MIEKRMIKLAELPNYRPSGFNKCNIVYGGNGLCPTITLAFAKANQPMFFVREEDEIQMSADRSTSDRVREGRAHLRNGRVVPYDTVQGLQGPHKGGSIE